MEVSFLMKKLLEIDKLKMILLNQDQRNLFDFIPRPFLDNKNQDAKYQKRNTIQHYKMINMNYQDLRNEQQKANDALDSF